jgi:hypothetical protein
MTKQVMNKESQAYIKAKRDADKKFKEKTSAYKSMYIVKQYKKYNGKFLSSKENKKGLTRWLNEKWIRVDPKTGKPMKKNGKLVDCGRSKTEVNKKIKKGMCRPYKKITKDTPKTVKELGKKEVKRRLTLKMKNPDKKLSGGKKTKMKKKMKKNKKINNKKSMASKKNTKKSNTGQDLHKLFKPNLTPKEVLKEGSFGGTYWRPITYKGKQYKDQHKKYKFGLDDSVLTLPWNKYNKKINKYGVKVGQTYEAWLEKDWISDFDPYGWFQWYCNYQTGRRCDDDERQIQRWMGIAGPNGRFRKWLVTLILKRNGKWNDYSISPKIRQTLLHWGYELTKEDFDAEVKSRQ